MRTSNPNSNPGAPSEQQPALRREPLLVQKIYDQCRFQDCIRPGPAISDENCECIILHPDLCVCDCPCGFGGFVRPGKPVRLPEWVKTVRCVDGSFRFKKISILRIAPSPLKGYWDITIEFVFEFKLWLFGEHQVPIQILCCPCCADSPEKKFIKDSLFCSVSYLKQTTLFGTAEDAPYVASDILPQQDFSSGGSPHVQVLARTEPVKFELVKPEKGGCCQDLPDDIYHEPFRHLFVLIALQADILLFRFACLTVDAGACCPPKKCPDSSDDPCAMFQKIAFPTDQFFP